MFFYMIILSYNGMLIWRHPPIKQQLKNKKILPFYNQEKKILLNLTISRRTSGLSKIVGEGGFLL